MCVLLRVGAIKHTICSLPLALNAQRANLTLTSNPLTRKRTNACRVYSTSNKQIHSLPAQVEWCSIDDENLIFIVSPIPFDSPISVPVPPPFHPTDGLPLTEHWHQMCSSSVDSGTSWAECASGSVNENGCAVCVCVCVLFTVVQWYVTVGGTLCGWGFSSVSLSELHCSSTQPCSAQQQNHQGWNYTATHPE